jgi:hypothetical protein
MPFNVNQIVTGTALKKEYDAYFLRLLRDHLDPQPRKRKEHAKFKVTKELPTKNEYLELRNKRLTVPVDGLIGDAYETITELNEEMQEAHDNMPESLQDGEIGQRRLEAAEALADFSLPDIPAEAGDIEVLFLPALILSSRSKRAGEAADRLKTAAQAIRDFVSEGDEGPQEGDALEDLAEQLEKDASELEGVEFPGMYG